MAAAVSAPTAARMAVVGAHLTGQPLHHQLTDRGAQLVATTRTAPAYRLYALATEPPKPGLLRLAADDPAGAAIEVEVWELGLAAFGSFVDAIPAPLGVGRVMLEDGTDVAGFLCEPVAVADAVDITQHGGWRAYLAAAGDVAT
ncbi:MAG: Amidase [Acidimicrobiales bacterium]|nr:Amidase [Acidimicrobiales bacterium]